MAKLVTSAECPSRWWISLPVTKDFTWTEVFWQATRMNVSSVEMIMCRMGEPIVSIISNNCIPRKVQRRTVWSREAEKVKSSLSMSNSNIARLPEMRIASSWVRATAVIASVCCSTECSISPVSKRRIMIDRSRDPVTICSLLCERVMQSISSWCTLNDHKFAQFVQCLSTKNTCNYSRDLPNLNWIIWSFDLPMPRLDTCYCRSIGSMWSSCYDLEIHCQCFSFSISQWISYWWTSSQASSTECGTWRSHSDVWCRRHADWR